MPDDATAHNLPETRPTGPQSAGDISTAPGNTSEPGAAPQTVGRYEIIGEIARGGMGVVYKARDPGLSREVAVKLVRGGPGSPAAGRRFLEEATITGQLQHPNIPPVFEVGKLPDENPFLAMKLIKGRTLNELLGDRPDPAAGRGQFLATFEQVCQAVAYAHGHGVIHRDLKPHNVMVGAFGEVQVMDWGLAKVLTRDAAPPAGGTEATVETRGTEIRSIRGPAQATRAGSVLGTLAYMPPEQAGGEVAKVDARSDVFGLGAILCVILTGRPPYVAADPYAIQLMAIRWETGEAFAALDGCGAEPDLVALAKRCLAKDRADRPADAGAVAAAVAGLRTAADERARRAELDVAEIRVRETESLKRRKVWYGLAGVLLGGLVASSALAVWAVIEAGRATTQRQKSDLALASAEAAHGRTLTALRKLSEDTTADRVGRRAKLTDRERQFFREVESLWLEFSDGRSGAPDGSALAAEGAFRVAKIRRHLGEWGEAEQGFRRALALWAEAHGAAPGPVDSAVMAATARRELGLVLTKLGKAPEAEQALDESAAALEKLMAAADPPPAAAGELARTYNTRANLFFNTRNLDRAEADYLKSLRLHSAPKTEAAPPSTPDDGVGMCHNNLGRLYAEQKRYADAEKSYLAAVEFYRGLVQAYPAEPDFLDRLGGTHMNLGVVYAETARPALAEQAFRTAATGAKKLAAGYPSVLDYQDAAGLACFNLGEFLQDSGRVDDARAAFGDCLLVYDALIALQPAVPDYQIGRADAGNRIAIGHNKKKEFAAALRQLGPARAAAAKAVQLDPSRAYTKASLQQVIQTECNALVGLGDHAVAARRADELSRVGANPPADAYDAATIYASCLKLAPADRPEPASAYATRAAELLQLAVSRGWKEYGRLKTDPEWEPVRKHPALAPLLTRLGGANTGGPGKGPPE